MPRGDGSEDDGHDGSGKGGISLVQFQGIAAAAAARDRVEFETYPPAGRPPIHVWQKGHILASGDVDIHDRELAEFEPELARDLDGSEQQTSPDWSKLLKLNNTQGRNTWDIVQYLNGRDRRENRYSVNNLMYVSHTDGHTNGANFCSAEEPVPLRPFPETIPYPPPSRGKAGCGVRIAVIDTGLSPGWRKGHPWLFRRHSCYRAGVSGEQDGTFQQNGRIAPDSGHGTFIAGVIRCIAPRARVKVFGAMRWNGAVTEHELRRKVFQALDERPAPHLINLSAGCIPMHDHNTQQGQESMAMRDVMNRLRRRDCHTLLVAAAGNDGIGPDDAWFYPAKFASQGQFEDLVVAVGALRQDRTGRACFSNHGRCVTVYEDGEKLVNAFPEGTFSYQEPSGGECVYHVPPLYEGCTCATAPLTGAVAVSHGMAQWSGTSFSAPIVVGRIARRMSRRRKFASRPRAAMRDLRTELINITDAGAPHGLLPVFPTPVDR